jgi:hypothetical protein
LCGGLLLEELVSFLLCALPDPLLLVGGAGRCVETENTADRIDPVDPRHPLPGIENADKDR